MSVDVSLDTKGGILKVLDAYGFRTFLSITSTSLSTRSIEHRKPIDGSAARRLGSVHRPELRSRAIVD